MATSQMPQLQPNRSVRLPAPLRGLAVAGERRRLLAWGEQQLFLLDYEGTVHASRSLSSSRIVAATVDALAEYVLLALRGWGLLCLNGALLKRWTLPMSGPVSVASSPFGECFAAGTERGKLLIVDRYGRKVALQQTLRPPRSVRFVAIEPVMYVAGDSTFLMLADLEGKPIWDERIWSPMGPLACPGTGTYVLVPTFTYGLERYRKDGFYEGSYQIRSGTRLVAVDFDGSKIVAATLDGYLVLLDAAGVIQKEQPAGNGELVAVDLTPGGEHTFIAYASGAVHRLDW